jgi:hypothetical protein
MSSSIEEYLDRLKTQLAGSDPAMIQDALSDAEEHLRTAHAQTRSERPELSDGDIVGVIVEAYGSPTDVAAAYRDIEDRVIPALSPGPRPRPSVSAPVVASYNDRPILARFFGVFIDPRAYASLFYMLFSLVTGLLYFTWAMTGISLSIGMIVLIIGLPFILVFLLSIQGIALVEGLIVEALLGVRMPRRPLFSSPHLGFWGRLKALATDKLSWTTLLYMLIQLPLGMFYFTVFLTMLLLGLAGIAYPIVSIFIDVPYVVYNEWLFYPPAWFHPILALVGVLWILVTLHLSKIVGRAHGIFAKALLVRD